jgi:hypothetical protein
MNLHPVSKILPNIDPGAAQQPVYLFNRMLGNQSPSVGQPLSYGVYRQRGATEHPSSGVGHG